MRITIDLPNKRLELEGMGSVKELREFMQRFDIDDSWTIQGAVYQLEWPVWEPSPLTTSDTLISDKTNFP